MNPCHRAQVKRKICKKRKDISEEWLEDVPKRWPALENASCACGKCMKA